MVMALQLDKCIGGRSMAVGKEKKQQPGELGHFLHHFDTSLLQIARYIASSPITSLRAANTKSIYALYGCDIQVGELKLNALLRAWCSA